MRQWVLGSYLMAKGETAAIALYQLGAPMGSEGGYGNWSYRSPEWVAEVGVALEPAVATRAGLWWRRYSRAVVLANPWPGRALTLQLPPVPPSCGRGGAGGLGWADLYGQPFKPGMELRLAPVTATTLVC